MLINRKSQQGFTLVELMIALTIGLVITGAVVQIFFSGLVVFRTQTGLAKLQENGRYAANFITQDARAAGYLGCDINSSKKNIITDASNNAVPDLTFTKTLDGFDNVTVGNKTFDSKVVNTGTDVLMLKYASTNNICEIANHDAATNSFTCQATHSFKKNQPLIATDCKHSAIFLQSNSVVLNTSSTIKHEATPILDPKNCSANLGNGTGCAATSYTFKSGSILALNSLTYFVAQNNLGQPALFRQVMLIDDTSNNLVASAREIVEGVEDIQILYGEDSNGDGSVNFYAPIPNDTNKVLSIRVQMLLRSVEKNLVDDFQTYTFNGAQTTATDHHLRKVFSTTIALRNK